MEPSKTKYVFVTGGVLSSLGKGIAAASLGTLLKGRGLKISILKLDPYLNVDPGTMNPFQHGEVFVTHDGAETDLDLGHYERFISVPLGKENSKTAGQIYQSVLEKERKGTYLGATVQVIPHVTDEIKEAIRQAGKGYDVLICEVGGTIGDIESLPFLEAIRQMRMDEGTQATLFVHVSYLPFVKAAGELKTKPTQHSVKELLGIGIQPDILVLRAENAVPSGIKEKIALFCNVPTRSIINCPDVHTVYQVPIVLQQEGLDEIVVSHFGHTTPKADLSPWEELVFRFEHPSDSVRIGVVGKYAHLVESYKSIHEALIHAGMQEQTRIEFCYIDTKTNEGSGIEHALKDVDGILVPGGFGEGGTKGKIAAVEYARTKRIPYFGICLGLQIAVIEFARNVLLLSDATSQEFDLNAKHPVVHMMEHQRSIHHKGGTMRLGTYPCVIEKDSLAHRIYGSLLIEERHRHRYEVNNAYKAQLEQGGMRCSGISPDGNLVEMIEIPAHPFFIACQFHPEFLSKPLAPHPLFVGFVRSLIQNRR